MSNLSKSIDATSLYDERGKAINTFVLKLIDDQSYEVNINYKLNRIHSEIKFVKDHIISYKKLTQREKEIITLLAKGNNNPHIASQLFISRSTVEQHRKNINSKLCVKSFPQLMRYAYAFDIDIE